MSFSRVVERAFVQFVDIRSVEQRRSGTVGDLGGSATNYAPGCRPLSPQYREPMSVRSMRPWASFSWPRTHRLVRAGRQ